MLKRTIFVSAVLAAGLAVGVSIPRLDATAQTAPQPTIKRTILQKFEIPDTKLEVILGLAEVPANTAVGRHTHVNVEMGTLIEGEAILLIDGQPERSLKPGDSYQIPGGVIHDAKSGPKGAKVIAVYTLPKGQPLAFPAK